MAGMLITFFACMVFILFVGFYAGRKTSGKMESFYLGDRKVGAWVTAISASASSESGWLVLGCVSFGYIYGVSAYWITLGCVLGFAFNWFFFAERMRSISAENGSLTVPEFLERVTGDRTKLVRLIGVIVIFVLMFTYVAAQLNAAGTALQVVFSWPYWVGVLIGAVVTILYTTIGGYRAVSWTDLWQGLLMAAALLVLPIIAFVSLGGVSEVKRLVAEQPAQPFHVFQGWVGDEYRRIRVEKGKTAEIENEGHVPSHLEITVRDVQRDEKTVEWVRVDCAGDVVELEPKEGATIDLSPIGYERLEYKKTYKPVGGDAYFSLFGGFATLVLLGWIVEMLGIGLGYPGSPHVVARFMAARSRREIVRGRAIALSWAVIAESGAITMGILARALFPDIADPEGGLLDTAKFFLPGIVVGLIVAAVFAALRSTADSQLLVASSAIVRDLCENVLGLRLDERKAMSISRVVVLVLGLFAVAFALTEQRLIFWFVLFSWAGLGASFGPPLILAVFWKRLSAAGAMAGMATGFLVTMVWKLAIRSALSESTGVDIYELVPAFLLSFLAAVVFSLLYPKRAES